MVNKVSSFDNAFQRRLGLKNARESLKVLPNLRFSFARIAFIDSKIRKISALVIAIILIPLRVMQDIYYHTKQLVGRVFRSKKEISNDRASQVASNTLHIDNSANKSSDKPGAIPARMIKEPVKDIQNSPSRFPIQNEGNVREVQNNRVSEKTKNDQYQFALELVDNLRVVLKNDPQIDFKTIYTNLKDAVNNPDGDINQTITDWLELIPKEKLNTVSNLKFYNDHKEILPCFHLFKKLETLDLSNNQLESLPEEFTIPESLTTLNLSGNEKIDVNTIPESVKDSQNLKIIMRQSK